jgi:hypothetical protein
MKSWVLDLAKLIFADWGINPYRMGLVIWIWIYGKVTVPEWVVYTSISANFCTEP